jgi:hypothetical protein
VSNQVKRRGIIIIGALLLAAAAFMIRRSYLRAARIELLELAASVRLSDSGEHVLTQCRAMRHLRCKHTRDSDILAETPLEFGATNWIVLFGMEKDAVYAVRIRTADSIKYQPPGSPADRERNMNRLSP